MKGSIKALLAAQKAQQEHDKRVPVQLQIKIPRGLDLPNRGM
jgi:hypothetical protein